MTKQKNNIDPIPEEFSSCEETAEFWDTHDTTDYPEAFQDVDVRVEFRKRHFEVEVEEDVMTALFRQAKKVGMPVGRLANKLLRQQLSTVS